MNKYSEQLKDPRWQKKRLYIFNRDHWRCVVCSKDDLQLQVHHLVYIKGSEPWSYPDEYLQTLCAKCHEQRQELTDKITASLRLSIANVPTERLEAVARSLMEYATMEMY